MPELLTEITEIVTGLGMSGIAGPREALAARPPVMRNVTGVHWDRLDAAVEDATRASSFAAAWANGRAFFESPDGLRGRAPRLIEWKGAHQPPGFDFVPADLRIDHVYVVSCKYQSKILANSSPTNLFVRRLADRTAGAETESWYATCAPVEYQRFYTCVRGFVGDPLLPIHPQQLTADEIQRIRSLCKGTWPQPLAAPWAELSFAVATASAARWTAELTTAARQEEMLWRLLRLSPASYFVLGSSAAGPLRLRIGTPWDWRQSFVLQDLEIAAVAAGQPKVNWSARISERETGRERRVAGHVEVRWAHGRFSSVEAKIYLDTPHGEVPGYFPLPTPEAIAHLPGSLNTPPVVG